VGFLNDLNQNYAAIRGLLREWIVGLIHDERPMWRDDGVDVGRGNIFDVHGTCTKSGDVITLTNVVAAGDADTLDSLHAAAFTSPKYLVTEADANLTAEVVVGATPGGELGGTWASPTVDATHSGSAHHDAVTLAADADELLSLTGQAIGFDTQAANQVLAGPVSGAAADPDFRALVDADIPAAIARDAEVTAAITAFFTETGDPQALTLGAIGNGQHLQRVNNAIVGSTLSGIYIAKSIVDTKGDIIVASADNTVGVVSVSGNNGYVLTEDSAQTAGLKWAAATGGGAMATDPLWDAKGDLAGGTGANTGARLAVGTNGFALRPASGETTGLKWGNDDRVIECAIYLNPVSDTIPKFISHPMPFACTIISAEIKSYTACGATSQVIDIGKQTAANEDTNTFATIWSTHANCLTLTNTHYQADTTTFDTTALAVGDRLYVFSHVLGTGLTVASISITVRPTP